MDEIVGKSIASIRRRYLGTGEPASDQIIAALAADPRASARQLAVRLAAIRNAGRSEHQRQEELLTFERDLASRGFRIIAGVDEAGVGPLAGPVIAAAIILPAGYHLARLDDSKRLSPSTRARLAARLKLDALAWAVGSADVEEIDRLNIYHASLLAMRRAVLSLDRQPDYLLVDARTIEAPIPQRAIIRGDSLSASIAAASVIAKTTRDDLMIELDRHYPGYGLAIHKGYGTAAHLAALRQFGPLPIHRRSFQPVREALSPSFSAEP